MKVLFVCTGNTCRSPMAQEIARPLFPGHVFMSAGLYAVSGQEASLAARLAAKEKGLDLDLHRAQQVQAALMEEADLVLAMTGAHAVQLKSLFPAFAHKVKRLGDQAGCGEDVPDPFGGGKEEYLICYEAMEKMLERMDLS